MRRSDTGPFAMIPRWLLDMEDIKGGDVYLYALLADHADRKDGTSYPAHKSLANRMGCSVDTVKRHLKTLVEQGAISIKHRETEAGSPTSNEYTIYRMPPEKALGGGGKNAPPSLHQSSTEQEPLNQTLRGGGEPPSARNLNNSGEKMRAWEDFLEQFSSRSSNGIHSPFYRPSSYARTCAQSKGWPPDVDLAVLYEVADCIKFGLGRKVVILPGLTSLRIRLPTSRNAAR